MASEKEIRTKIASIKNTQKITKAMEMVAASKMRKAQDRMAATRPYAKKMLNVIGHLAHAHQEYKHPFLTEREEIKKVGLIIVSTDRGLCGGLNINLFKSAVMVLKEWESKNIGVELCLIGTKATGFFKRFNANMTAQVSDLGDTPEIEQLIGCIKTMLDNYLEGNIDQLYIVENEFVNTMSQKPKVTKLLPTEPDDDQELDYHWDYIYEPDSKDV